MRDIKRRKSSIQSTQQITKAMKLVSTVKLQKAILSLPTKQQATFNMRYYDELSYDEIAEATGSTTSAAKMNFHIAKEKIIKYMNSNY